MKTPKRKRKQKARAGFAALGGSASPVAFNINDYVMVKLTDYGRQCLRKNYDDLKAYYGGKLGFDYTPPKEDKDGWSKWQAWSLMADLGKHILMGFDPPFKTTIKVMLNDKDQATRQGQAANT